MDLICPFTMLVSGVSGCGKTVWVAKLLKTIRPMFDNVILAYTMYQNIYEQLRDEYDVELIPGMPEDIPPNTLLIIDDMMLDCSKDMASLFTRMRHASVSTIFIVQALFFDNKYMRVVNRNCNYLVLFPNPRDVGAISKLGSQMGKSKYVVSAFEQATSVPYGYLFLDLKANVKHRVKTGILQGEVPHIYLCTE